jgi:GntR family transcriptional repressor for pyruvate dehydrogenase complex
MFSELSNKRIYEKIVEQIKGLIKDGQLKPNDQLPAERELAKMLGCSRTSLREACRVLESEGLIISKPGGGRFIQKVDQRLILKYQINPIDILEKSTIIQFLEVREVLEPKIAEFACERATNKDLEKLKNALERMKDKLLVFEKEIDADSNFHLALAEASHNFLLISFMETNLNLYRQVRKQTLRKTERYYESINEHKAIYDAIINRDSKLAVNAVNNHLKNLRENILNILDK